MLYEDEKPTGVRKFKVYAEAKCKAVLWFYAESYEEAQRIADEEPDSSWEIVSGPEIIEAGEPEEV